MTQAPEGVRLQKVLAAAGLGSRRACEQLIDEGRVEVDGRIVREQGTRVDPARAAIKVDGLRIASAPGHVYLALNKPKGVVSTMSDPEGRPSLAEYVADRSARLFNVGRLDVDTEGLILLTNDGELAHRLAHPSFGVEKTYLAEVTGPVARDVGRRLRDGVELDDGPVQADGFRLVSTVGSRVMVEVSLHEGRQHVVRRMLAEVTGPVARDVGRRLRDGVELDDGPVQADGFRLVSTVGSRVMVEVSLHEGRKHVVRRMLAEVGHPVTRLVRTQVGPVVLGNLKPGKHRRLSQQEVGALYKAVGL